MRFVLLLAASLPSVLGKRYDGGEPRDDQVTIVQGSQSGRYGSQHRWSFYGPNAGFDTGENTELSDKWDPDSGLVLNGEPESGTVLDSGATTRPGQPESSSSESLATNKTLRKIKRDVSQFYNLCRFGQPPDSNGIDYTILPPNGSTTATTNKIDESIDSEEIKNYRTNDLPVVDLDYIQVQAQNPKNISTIQAFANIRYAAPANETRWQPPTSPLSGDPIYDHPVQCLQSFPEWITKYALEELDPSSNTSLLAGVISEITNNTLEQDLAKLKSIFTTVSNDIGQEDCLFLDVWRPSTINEGDNVPVTLWIHGGGYVLGSKNSYDATGLIVASNYSMIVVAINYRLGAFGFLSGNKNVLANVGFQDQLFAMRWIQNYISRFGGDPNSVTIMGESAGGGSVMHHITAYGGGNIPSPPLFHRAVVQSPAWVPLSDPNTLSLQYAKFKLAAGCLTFGCLSSASVDALSFANILLTFLAVYGQFTWGPTIDGDYVPAEPGKLLLEGKFNNAVQVMAGHNINEGRLFTNPTITTDAAVINYVDSTLTQASPEIDDYILNTLYPENGLPQGDLAFNNYSTQLARAQLITSELGVTCNTNYLARAFQNSTYNYIFAVDNATHSMDVPYTFYNPILSPNQTIVDGIGGEMPFFKPEAVLLQSYIANFAVYGNPNGPGLTEFPIYGAAMVLMFDNDANPVIGDPTANERCVWWQTGAYMNATSL